MYGVNMICRKSMEACQTPGMCSPHGGCQDADKSELAALREELETSRVAHHETAKVASSLREELADKHEELSAVLGRESLTEQRLEAEKKWYDKEIDDLQQRLTAAEQRNAELVAEIVALPDEFKELSGCENTANTLIISRDLAERLTNKYRCTVSQLEIHKRDIEELRAILAEPMETINGHHPSCRAVDDYKPGDCSHACAAPVVERQEPIYQVQYLGAGGGWSDAEKASYDALLPHPNHWKTRIVYASPPAPVAVVLPTMDDLLSSVESIWGCGLNQLCLLDGNDLKLIWNACLDKVKELNQ